MYKISQRDVCVDLSEELAKKKPSSRKWNRFRTENVTWEILFPELDIIAIIGAHKNATQKWN